MRSRTGSEQSWVLQPLVDAGLTADEIGALLLRLAFDDVVGTPADAMAPVGGRPAAVRAAWVETIDRLLALGEGAPGPADRA